MKVGRRGRPRRARHRVHGRGSGPRAEDRRRRPARARTRCCRARVDAGHGRADDLRRLPAVRPLLPHRRRHRDPRHRSLRRPHRRAATKRLIGNVVVDIAEAPPSVASRILYSAAPLTSPRRSWVREPLRAHLPGRGHPAARPVVAGSATSAMGRSREGGTRPLSGRTSTARCCPRTRGSPTISSAAPCARAYGDGPELAPLDDALEIAAHHAAIERARTARRRACSRSAPRPGARRRHSRASASPSSRPTAENSSISSGANRREPRNDRSITPTSIRPGAHGHRQVADPIHVAALGRLLRPAGDDAAVMHRLLAELDGAPLVGSVS